MVADRRLACGRRRASGAAALPQSDRRRERRRRARGHAHRLAEARCGRRRRHGCARPRRHGADRMLADCSLATQQRTEIARAVARDARVFLFDEPNSALTARGVRRTVPRDAQARRLRPHRASSSPTGSSDLVAHCARVAVIRDGRVRTILSGEALTEEGVARAVGDGERRPGRDRGRARQGSRRKPRRRCFPCATGRTARAFRDVDFDAQAGEIVALMGVEGSGARELLRSFAGLERTTGSIALDRRRRMSACAALRSYVPATRAQSLYSNFSVGDNLARPARRRRKSPGAGWRSSAERMRALAQAAVKRFLVKTGSTLQPIRSLSGGNQQKVAIAQALLCSAEVAAPRGADARRRHPLEGRDLSPAARIRGGGKDGRHVLHRGAGNFRDRRHRLCRGGRANCRRRWRLAEYEHVEQLATDITRLESHRPAPQAARR